MLDNEVINNKEFYFTELVDSARSPGWYEARCDYCDNYTTGSESVVEDWAYDHECVFDDDDGFDRYGVNGYEL